MTSYPHGGYTAVPSPHKAFGGDFQPPGVQEMPVPGRLAPYDGPVDARPLIDAMTANLIGNMPGITVRQRHSLVEAISGGMCEMKNRYTLHPGAGYDALDHPPFMAAMERSNGCSRCCCAPYHNVFVEFKHSHDPEAPGPVAFTFERQGVCGKCVSCCNFCNCALDSMNMHAGPINDDPDNAGKLSDYSRVFGSAKQPAGCSCTPTLDIFDGTTPEQASSASSIMHGPFCFGGCSELCCESEFPVSRPHSGLKLGDVAIIKKLAPKSCEDVCGECFGDADRYYIEFKDKSLTPQQKATLLGTLMLTDFMFFEQDNGMCQCRDRSLKITCFMCYCSGCLCPCNIVLSGKNDSGQ